MITKQSSEPASKDPLGQKSEDTETGSFLAAVDQTGAERGRRWRGRVSTHFRPDLPPKDDFFTAHADRRPLYFYPLFWRLVTYCCLATARTDTESVVYRGTLASAWLFQIQTQGALCPSPRHHQLL